MTYKPEIYLYLLISLILCSISAKAYTPQYADETETIPLRWRNKTISISISNSFLKQNTNIKPDSEVLEAVRKSFAAWENIADIRFEIKQSEKQTISPAGKNGDGVSLITIAQTSENLLLFNGENSEAAAFTRIFFNRRGNITEADIVLNPYGQFSTDGTIGTFDLQATLTHEIGHLLGLGHSSVTASTVYAHQGKNGTYSLPNFSYQTLSDDDITGIRDLYGAESGNQNCCGTLQGRIFLPKSFQAKALEMWLEEVESGRTVAALETNIQGRFKVGGLSEGRYRIFVQGKQNTLVAAGELGKIEISKNKITLLNEKFSPQNKNYDLKFSGFNGQLSDTVIPVNRGNSYLIYFSGKNIESENFEIGFNSPFLTVNQKSLIRHNYGDEFAVFSFEVIVDSEAPNGDYSLYFRDKKGASDFIIGGVSVEEMTNPWAHQSF